MNILLYDFLNSYIQSDLVFFLTKMGHKCNNIPYFHAVDKYNDDPFSQKMEKDLSDGKYDLVFTSNFWPIVSKVCLKHNIPYISWFYDSPPNLPSAECMDYSVNSIFFFARADYADYKAIGLDNVYYLPLAVNTKRLNAIRPDFNKYSSEISFVGKLYSSMLPALMNHMTDYQKGYLDAVVNAQMQIYGGYIVDDAVTESFTESVRLRYRELSDKAIQVTRKELAWAVASHVTNLERLTLLRLLSRKHKIRLYTFDVNESERNLLSEIQICGPVDYLTEMPQVFKGSKINLCPVLKANRSGIPLRALDSMGCGGFLLSSFQSELAEYFVNGRECVMYGSVEEAMELADYYIAHEEIRKSIANAGFLKAEKDFAYEERINTMLNVAGLKY